MLALILAAFAFVNGSQPPPSPELRSLQDLARFVGTFPCSNGLLRSPVILDALKAVLGDDDEAYLQHIGLSGCGQIERRGDYLLMDVSQEHVGGYSSLILVQPETTHLYLFWLQASVAEKKYKVYGARPIPKEVMAIIGAEMNVAWGHVARFTAKGETLEITMNPRDP